ncbi:MAG: sialate O-acetylesterase, partial [Novosphingobium sp.]
MLASLLANPALAKPVLDPVFTSGAVLQRDRVLPVRGNAKAGTQITVALGDLTASAVTGRDGRWQVDLPPRSAGGPYQLIASDGNGTATLDDVMIGDVWLCSGQSNMEFALRQVTNADGEVAQSDDPLLRLFNMPRQSSAAPQAAPSSPVSWQRSTPASAADFSAACYFMGRDLQAHQGIAIGLINASWGGSMIEEWLSREALATLPRYRPQLALLDTYRQDPSTGMREWAKMLATWFGPRLTPPPRASWRPVAHLRFWEDLGGEAAHFDGTGYYRAHVMLKPDQTGEATLSIGSIDDMDLTRVNGRLVGAMQGWNTARNYAVPAGYLHSGDNVIDVAVADTGGGGGIWGTPPALVLANGEKLPWERIEFTLGAPLSQTGAPVAIPWIGGSGRTSLFNGMIAPLGNFPLCGVAWYQGEANVSDPAGYAELMPLLVADWRARFGGKPFIITQLANFGALATQPSDDAWGRFRDLQRRIADADPQIGMASAVDIGQPGDIHPTNKQDVGKRLALAARRLALGEDVIDRGPSPANVTRGTGGIIVRFAHGPLKLVGGGEALGFELCDGARLCRFVPGRLEDNAITLPADPAAREVRYLWQASPLVNLYNEAGLPASGFSLPIPGN